MRVCTFDTFPVRFIGFDACVSFVEITWPAEATKSRHAVREHDSDVILNEKLDMWVRCGRFSDKGAKQLAAVDSDSVCGGAE